MRSTTLKLLALLLIVALAGCNSLKKMADNADKLKYQVTPNPLEMHAGKVPVSISVQFPPKFFPKKAYLVITPTLTNANGEELNFKSTTLQGEKVKDNNPVIKYKTGGSYTYIDTVNYDPKFRKSDLVLKFSANTGGNGQSVTFVSVKIGQGIITTPELVDPGLIVDNGTLGNTNKGLLKTIRATISKPKTVPQQQKLVLYYPLQQSRLPYKEQRKPEVDTFLNKLQQLKNNPDIDLQGIAIASYASPDGPIDLNHDLVQGRGKTATDFMTKKFKKGDFEEFASDKNITRETTPDEDWEGFKTLVQQSNIEDKEVILRVLSMYSDPNVREQEIKKMAEVYETLKKEILPKLRRAEIIATYQTKERTPEEMIQLAKTDPDKLSREELFFAAQSAQGADKETIYKTYISKYSDDWKAYNNLAVYYIKENRLTEAENELQKAENIQQNNTAVLNNYGVLYYAKGDMAKAKDYFHRAYQLEANPDVGYNCGVLLIKQGKYQEAVQKFGAPASYNKSLAQLLVGNTADAINTLNSVKSDNAYYYYLKAVEAARNSDQNGVFTNLQTAIQKDASLKDYAKNDLEFRDYFDDDTFKSLVE